MSPNGHVAFLAVAGLFIFASCIHVGVITKDVPGGDAPAASTVVKNLKAIGELPPMKIGGHSIKIILPAMSILRFDATL